MSVELVTATALAVDASYRVSGDALRAVIGHCLSLDEAAARALHDYNSETYGYLYQERYGAVTPRLEAIDAHEDYVQNFLARRRQNPQPLDYYRGRFVVSLALSDQAETLYGGDLRYGIGLWVRPLAGPQTAAS